MEAFVAVISLDRNLQKPILAMVDAGIGMVSSPDIYVERFSDQAVAIAVQKRSFASDTYFGQFDDKLIYIQGWVEPLGIPQNSDSLYRLTVDKLLPKEILANEGSAADLTGSYHILTYDIKLQTLSVFTDRLASRTIYYYRGPNYIALSSDIQAILGIPGVDYSLDLEGLVQFVRIQTILDDRTLYRQIRTLMPGTVLTINDENVDFRSYWRMEPLEPFEHEEQAVLTLTSAFERAGERITRGSKDSSILLSGGIDSRMTLCVAIPHSESLKAFTFGPSLTDEGQVARLISQAVGVDWHLVTQNALDYWDNLTFLLPVLQARFSIAHAHTYKSVALMAQKGIDTVLDGWGLDLFFSGSYLPKEYWRIAGRKLYTFKLSNPFSMSEVTPAILQLLDIQEGDFKNSFLDGRLMNAWSSAVVSVINKNSKRLSYYWADPYDQIEKFFSAQMGSFRSFPVTALGKTVMRQRNPLFDSEVIDAYLRLSTRQRFLGPTFRASLKRINSSVAQITYSNIGTSPYAHPYTQAIILQSRQLWRGNRERANYLLRKIGCHKWLKLKHYGSYPNPSALVQVLAQSTSAPASATRNALLDGFMVQNGIVNREKLQELLTGDAKLNNNEATTLLALASLAAWFSKYPATVSI